MESATCIVVLVENGKTWIGGDSAGIEPSTADVTILKNKKVFTRVNSAGNVFLFGFSGPYRLGQILQYAFLPPTIEDEDLMAYIVNPFIRALQQCFKEVGYEQTDNGRSIFAGTFVVCIQGRVFKISAQYAINEPALPYFSIGCGQGFALGSLYSTEGKPPLERVQLALEAAERFSGGVQRPFDIITE